MDANDLNPHDERRGPEPKPMIADCPVCEGQMELVYARNNQQVTVCKDCHAGLTIPATAWDVVRLKRGENGGHDLPRAARNLK